MRFTALDSRRGIGALAVASSHFKSVSYIHSTALVRHSYLFVDFFFVLSGFVIAHAYLDKLKTAGDVRSTTSA